MKKFKTVFLESFEERSSQQQLLVSRGIGRITSIKSEEDFMKWNLELHQGLLVPYRVIHILWIKSKSVVQYSLSPHPSML